MSTYSNNGSTHTIGSRLGMDSLVDPLAETDPNGLPKVNWGKASLGKSTIPGAQSSDSTKTTEGVRPTRVGAKTYKRLADAPLRLQMMRRLNEIAHASRAFADEHPMLALAAIGGAGAIVVRLLPGSVRRKAGFALATFIARRALSLAFDAIEDSTAESA